MGTYVYKVTSKTVTLVDGTKANVAVFAYKPTFWDEKADARMAFKSGCHAADRLVGGDKYTGRVVLGSIAGDPNKVWVGSTHAFEMPYGTFEDNNIGGLTKVGETGADVMHGGISINGGKVTPVIKETKASVSF